MTQRLKSNFKYVWDNLLFCLLYGLMLYGGIFVLPGVLETGEPGQVEDGYCRIKQKYIIILGAVENRLALRECGIIVEE